MNEFQTTLAAFLAGRAEFSQLDAALLRSLQTDPSIGPAAYAAIDDLRRSGRLPLQLFVVLKNRIARSHATAGPRPMSAPHQGPQPQVAPAPVAPPQMAPPLPHSDPPVSGASLGSGSAGPAAEAGGDRTVFGAQRPRHGTGSSGPTSSSRPSIPPAAYSPAPETDARPTGAAPTDGHAAAPPPQPAAPASGERTIMGARPPAPTAGVSQPHSFRPLDPSVPTAVTGGFDPTPTGATGSGRTGAPFTARTGTTGGTAGSGWSDPSKWADQPSIALERGAELKGRFVLENVVGRGGMGVVFRAKDLRKEEAQDRDPYVAIKILNDEFRRHPESLKALQREARKSQALAHPNIVNVFDFDRDGATVYMTMEFLEGESLDRIIKNPQFEGMPFDEAYPLIDGLGQALRYAHNKQIVHSDFKPGNCFLTKSGVIKVFDFGIAQAAKLQGAQHGEVTRFDPGTLGALTPAYASCEMIDGEAPDPRDDIYAFGCVIYELLTSKHPFSKKSAAEARDQKLVPLPIKKLTRRQWRALAKSLAFRRADRSANIDELLSGLAKQPFNPARLAVGVAALLIVAAVGYFGLLQWQAQQSDRLVAALQSRDDARVPAAIERLRGLETRERDAILSQVREPLIAWYEGLIRRAVDQAAGRYDYPQAMRVLDEADTSYPDNGTLVNLRAALNRDKAELLDQLDRRFRENIGAGRLLPDPNAEDIAEVLEILTQADPGSTLLADTALTIAYGEQAAAALEREEFGNADQLITLGLARDPSDSVLTDLRFKLNAARESAANAEEIERLQAQLRPAANMETLEQLLGIASTALDLARIAPADPSLRPYYGRLGAALTAEVERHLTGRDWAAAQRSIESVAAVLPPEYSREATSRLTAARGDYDTQRDRLVASVDSAAAARRMGDAQNAIRELERIGADASTLRQARTVLENGYLVVVQEHIGGGRFPEATTELENGLDFDAGFTRLAALQKTISDQERFAREADAAEVERQKLATIQTHRSTIEAFLNRPTPTIDDAKDALAAADQLAALAPTDPRAGSRAHEPIAAKLAQRAAAVGATDLAGQLAFLDEALGLIGDSPALQTARTEARNRQEQLAAGQRQQQLASLRQVLDGLLASPRSEESWVTAVRKALADIRGVAGADDATAAQGQQRAAEILLARSSEARGQRRLSEAETLIGFAAGFAPQLDGLAAERQSLAEAQRRARQEETERAAAARVDAAKQTFTARANADNINEARATFVELRRLLPADDPFVTTTAPQALSDIYLRLARGAFDRGDFARAEQLADQGAGEYAGNAGLGALIEQIRRARTARLESNVAALGAVLDGGAGDVNQAKALLTSIQSDAGNGFAGVKTQLEEKATARIASNPRDEAYLRFVSAVFEREFTAPPISRPCEPGLAGAGGRAQARCFDLLGAERGPTLVVVPGVGGNAPFAISRGEASIADWNIYCRLSTRCAPITGSRQDFTAEPVTNVAVTAVVEYAAWLTQQTRFTYRLPTREEWMHVAAASRAATIDHNCVTSNGRGGAVRQASSGSGNDWGVLNYLGNVREWVTTGGGYEARGGDYMLRLDQCTADRAEASSGEADERTGFRLVRELRGAGP